jgi:hypothetical protein
MVYAAVFPNMGDASETHRWIKSLDGADNARMHVMWDLSLNDLLVNFFLFCEMISVVREKEGA